MNILVITDKLYPDEYGGSCTVAYELIKHWQKNNVVDIFTCYPENKNNDYLFVGIVNRNFIKKNLFYTVLLLKKMLLSKKYDVIVTHSILSWLIYFFATFNNYNKANLIAIFHGPWHKEAYFKYDGNKSRIKKFFVPKIMFCLEYLYCRYNDNYIFLSKYMKKELEKVNAIINKKNLYFIPGGISLEKYKRNFSKLEAKKLLGIPDDKCVLFTLRRLDKRMGIDRVIEALSLMDKKDQNNFIFFIGGKGDYRKILENKAANLKNTVHFLGFIPDDKLNLYFCAADIFIVPTLDLEGFGLVNLESLAMGVPVLATPQGGMVELSDYFNHLHLCKENNILSLYEGIKKYSIQYLDIDHITEDRIEDFNWENIANQYLNVFKYHKR